MVSLEKAMKEKNYYRGWVTHAWRKEDADAKVIQVQKYLLILLGILCAIFSMGWITAPSRLTVYIPPDIQNGATIKVGTVPAPLIYSFAYEVWQEINYWPVDGESDYKKNIHQYVPYLTPLFKSELLAEYAELKASGQVQRIRYLQGLSGAAYEAVNVKRLSNHSWEVNLSMRLTEYKNNQPVKDVEIIYPLKIIRTNVSPRHNPYGLAIAGFTAEPKRTTTYI
jgi:integrating conjugative element protein (TIGR03746 family)